MDAGDFAVLLSALLDGFAVQIALEDTEVTPAQGVRADHAVRVRPAWHCLERTAHRKMTGSGMTTLADTGRESSAG